MDAKLAANEALNEANDFIVDTYNATATTVQATGEALITALLGMISHKKLLITIFGHTHKIKNFNSL